MHSSSSYEPVKDINWLFRSVISFTGLFQYPSTQCTCCIRSIYRTGKSPLV